MLQGVHGYAGGKCTCGIGCDKLRALWMCVGYIDGGDLIKRPVITEAVFDGAKSGVTYTLTRSDAGNLQVAGDRRMFAVCI